MKFVERDQILTAAMLQVVEVEKLTLKKRGPDDLPYRITLDTPVDGGAGVVTIDISEERATLLGLIQ